MMKYVYLVFCFVFFSSAISAQKKISQELKIEKVKVFSENAQIVRTGKVTLTTGTEILTLKGLSPHLIESSITVGGDGDFQIVSLRRVTNHLDSLVEKEQYSDINKMIKGLNLQFKKIDARLRALAEEADFILSNRNLVGSDMNYTLEKLKQTADYFRERIEAIALEQIDLVEQKYTLNTEKAKYQSQLRELQPDATAIPLKQVEIEIKVGRNHMADIKLSYLVSRAGWHSEYDLRVGKLSEGIQLDHKAAIFQNTEVEWKNVEVALSTAEPQLSADAPSLNRWILGENYHRPVSRVIPKVAEPSYGYSSTASIEGYLTDEETGEPIIFGTVALYKDGVNVSGTDTDINGYYIMSGLLPGNYSIEYSYVGYNSKKLIGIGISTQRSARIDASIGAGVFLLESVQIVSHRELFDVSQTSAGAVISAEKIRNNPNRNINGIASTSAGVRGNRNKNDKYERIDPNMSNQQLDRTTSREYLIDIPLSVASDGNPKTVTIEEKKIDAYYEHQCTPKIDLNAYLIARLTDWEKYNFPQGHSSLYFEDTYVGKTYLNFEENTTDTISVSLGRDENVVLTRERSYKKTKTPLLGKKKTEIAWDIKLRNTKDEAVFIKLVDQIPISTFKEVVVESEHGDATLDAETGSLIWEFSLSPNKEMTKDFRYTVSYPKSVRLGLE